MSNRRRTMRRRLKPNPKSDRVLGGLLGGILGMLFSCCLGIAALSILGISPTVAPTSPPPVYDIEAIVEEDYINRIVSESAAGFSTPVPLAASHVDVRPGGQVDFAAQVRLGPLRPVVHATAALRASAAGEFEVVLIEARIGYLPLTALVPADLIATMNETINQQLAERTGETNVRVAGITSDETTLHLYLVSAP